MLQSQHQAKADFSLKRNNMTELFEDNQRDLERAVENLGYLLEQNIDNESISKLRQDITNQSVSFACRPGD
jgi:ariadne-1